MKRLLRKIHEILRLTGPFNILLMPSIDIVVWAWAQGGLKFAQRLGACCVQEVPISRNRGGPGRRSLFFSKRDVVPILSIPRNDSDIPTNSAIIRNSLGIVQGMMGISLRLLIVLRVWRLLLDFQAKFLKPQSVCCAKQVPRLQQGCKGCRKQKGCKKTEADFPVKHSRERIDVNNALRWYWLHGLWNYGRSSELRLRRQLCQQASSKPAACLASIISYSPASRYVHAVLYVPNKMKKPKKEKNGCMHFAFSPQLAAYDDDLPLSLLDVSQTDISWSSAGDFGGRYRQECGEWDHRISMGGLRSDNKSNSWG